MAWMRRIALAGLCTAALAGAAAAPASADVVSDLGLLPEGLATLPVGFDPNNFDPLAIESNIIQPGPTLPVDMDGSALRNPPGTAAQKPAASATKAKKARKNKRARRARGR